jgi:hypothetical protein
MKRSTVPVRTLSLVLGFLFVGSAAALVRIAQSAKENERLPGCVVQEPGGGTFVVGAYA